MALLFKNVQRFVNLNHQLIERDIILLRQLCNVDNYDLGVLCVDNKTIRYLNKHFRKKDEPTDILSFPFFDNVKAGILPPVKSAEERNLGDMYLGIEYIKERCIEENRDFYGTITILLTHGLCHLLGYDHETQAQWRQMFDQEMKILDKYNKLIGTNLQPITTVGHGDIVEKGEILIT